MDAKKTGRYWEVDAARGVAILMMVVYHTAFDLYSFGGYDIDATSGAWARFADLTAASFLFLVGVSLAISYRRDVASGRASFWKYLLRGLKVIACGMILTVVFYFFGMGYVVFGILHLIGVSIILAYPLLRFRYLNLVFGLLIFAAGLYIFSLDVVTQSYPLIPFGFVPDGFPMPDYRPLLPWFGVVLVGVFAGKTVYDGGRSPVRGDAPPLAKPLLPLGRHSLAIYLVHQPIIIVLLSVTGIIDIGLF